MMTMPLLLAALALPACGSSTSDQSQPVRIEEPGTGAGGEPGVEPGAGDEPVTSEPGGGATGPTVGGGEPAGEPGSLVVGDDPCESDADCVPAQCCHATACVSKDNAPNCTDMMCTEECRYGTLDCGGECLCHEGKCAARLSEPPEGVQDLSPQ